MQFPDTPATWEAFVKLKEALASTPVLIHTDLDHEFILYIDTCYEGVAGILPQISAEDNKEHPILYISRRLNVHEAKYSATELECLGMVWSLDKLTHYVDELNSEMCRAGRARARAVWPDFWVYQMARPSPKPELLVLARARPSPARPTKTLGPAHPVGPDPLARDRPARLEFGPNNISVAWH